MTAADGPRSQFWDDLAQDMRDPEFRVAYLDATARMGRCDLCNLTGDPCPGIPAHCRAGDHCIDTVEVCALEWRGGDNPGGHPYRCEDCGADLREAS